MKHIAEKLKNNEFVSFNPRGNSMTPKIKSGDLVTIRRLTNEDKLKLKKGNIVFCKVKSNYYLHLIVSVKSDQVLIGNNHGNINGWTGLDNVFAIKVSDR